MPNPISETDLLAYGHTIEKTKEAMNIEWQKQWRYRNE
jgi:hypothetical protein